MAKRRINPALKTLLDYGPLVGFLAAYFWLRDVPFVIGGVTYSGIVAVTAAVVPVFVLASCALWWLTGRVARIQVATLILLVVFAAISLWLNDDRLIKMKPTVIYLVLAAVLGLGLLLRRNWVQMIMEDAVPLSDTGWRLLTVRLVVLFVLAALANELIWRTQSDMVWLVFEAVVMPLIVVAFFVAQVGLYIEHAKAKQAKTKGKAKRAKAKAHQK